MNIEVTGRYTSRVLNALASAGSFHYDWNYTTGQSGKTYLCSGYRFTNTRRFCDWMLSELTGWMVENELVDMESLKQAQYADGTPCFNID